MLILSPDLSIEREKVYNGIVSKILFIYAFIKDKSLMLSQVNQFISNKNLYKVHFYCT